MAFTGTAVVTSVSDREVVITGLSLASAAAGTIGLFANSGTPGVRLPASFEAALYSRFGNTVPLSASIEVTTQPDAIGVATAIPIAVVKTGTTPADWLATLTNTHGSLTSPNQEIRVKFH